MVGEFDTEVYDRSRSRVAARAERVGGTLQKVGCLWQVSVYRWGRRTPCGDPRRPPLDRCRGVAAGSRRCGGAAGRRPAELAPGVAPEVGRRGSVSGDGLRPVGGGCSSLFLRRSSCGCRSGEPGLFASGAIGRRAAGSSEPPNRRRMNPPMPPRPPSGSVGAGTLPTPPRSRPRTPSPSDGRRSGADAWITCGSVCVRPSITNCGPTRMPPLTTR